MYTNTSMTIYNKKFDVATRKDKWLRTVIDKVFWDATKAYNRLQSGLENSDEVTIFIPFDYGSEKRYIPPMEYDKLEDVSNYFTFKTGDRVVKGSIDLGINRADELDRVVEAYTITSIDTKDYGSRKMRHWQLGGK